MADSSALEGKYLKQRRTQTDQGNERKLEKLRKLGGGKGKVNSGRYVDIGRLQWYYTARYGGFGVGGREQRRKGQNNVKIMPK